MMEDVERVFDDLGIETLEKSNRLAFCCPIHDDKNPSAGYYFDSGLCHCYSCGYTLDIVKFYAKIKGVSWDQAAKDFLSRYNYEWTAPVVDQNVEQTKKTFIKMEKRLLAIREKIGLEDFAEISEKMDKIIYAYKQKQIDDSLVDKLSEMWYNMVIDLEEGI